MFLKTIHNYLSTNLLSNSHGFGTIESDIVGLTNMIKPTQVHGDTIQIISDNSPTAFEADGLITKKRGITLGIKTADCMPILYADEEAGIVGISHNGWRGSVLHLASKMIKKMIDEGADLKNIKVVLGPSIGACCYSISDERVDEIKQKISEDEYDALQLRAGTAYLNILHLNYLHVLKAGVSPKNINFFPFCTFCDSHRFYSYRRRQGSEGPQMLNFISL